MKNLFVVGGLACFCLAGLSACGTETVVSAPPEKSDVKEVERPTPLPRGEQATDIVAGAKLELTISEAGLRARIAEISDDKYEGRAPTTPGGIAAGQWVADEMARIGLSPAVDGGWFQPTPLVESTLNQETSRLDFAINGEPFDLPLNTDKVFWTKKINEDLKFDPTEVVFVGYGVVAPEYGWDDYAGIDVTGKTVVMLINDPGFVNPKGELFNGKAMTYYGRWTYKFEEAGRQGAAAAIIVHETAPASYGWGVVSGSWTGAQYDLERPDGGANRTILEGWISYDGAKRLFSQSGHDYQALKASAAKPGFKPSMLQGVTASGSVQTSIKHLVSRNVAGVLPGAKTPDEYVLYMGHWDHLGKKDVADGEDGIFNGAVDNATGVAGILTIADAFARQETRPDRSILFVAVTAEESGLLGSAYFAEDPIVPLNKIVGGINIDALLPAPRARDMEVVGFGSSEMEDILKSKAARHGKTLIPDQTPEAGHFYRSDHISLAKKGVPMLYGGGGSDLVVGGEEAGKKLSETYRTDNYHKVSDEYHADWDISGMAQDYDIMYLVGEAMSHDGVWPNWYEGNEFKALRDAMMQE
ncbi:Gll4423 protein [hydrothermal vent metagenome]|uniref:Gll4423 protein n=1 Tax=hydrothermal vent metagenome TaxID=652676 RepID=A0A3B0RU63_9ZZZZ